MAFKSMKDYNEQRFGGMFLLRNDGDYADVIFMYRSIDDVLVADTHYIKSPDYSGYVHCCGHMCPACAKGIRVQTRLFIPVYNIEAQEIQFFDRSMRFENQLNHDVFSKFPNPSEYVFRITRHGAAGDVNTTYQIVAVGKNTYKSYYDILNQCNAQFPDYFDNICKDYSIDQLNFMLNASQNSAATTSDMPGYTVTPRVPTTNSTTDIFNVPETSAIEVPDVFDAVSEEDDPLMTNDLDIDNVDF